jgi:hypothetical protein
MAAGHLALDSTIATFNETKLKLVRSGWKGGDAKWNLERVAEPAMRALRAAGVPEPALAVADESVSAGLGAAFDVRTWTITAATPRYVQPQDDVTDAEMQSCAAAMYHEARHAEQFFLAAIVIARKWKWSRSSREQILQEDLAAAVWEAAGKSKIRPSAQDVTEIAGWIDAYSGVRRIMANLSGARADLVELGDNLLGKQIDLGAVQFSSQAECEGCREMLTKYEADAAAAKAAYENALAAYVGQAHEVDAYTVGAEAGGVRPGAAAFYGSKVGSPLRNLEGLATLRLREYDSAHPPQTTPTSP